MLPKTLFAWRGRFFSRKNSAFRDFWLKKKGCVHRKKKKKFPPTKRDFVALSVVTRKERQSRSLRVALRGTLFKQVKVVEEGLKYMLYAVFECF